MSVSEFDLIRDYFARATGARADVLLGIGDDCALLRPPPGLALAVSVDTLVAGRHFLVDADPLHLGHKALAVNLSDLAAMGAQPAWATLALTLPQVDRNWLRAFMDGFAALAATHDVQLVGGDTTRGPLSITVQVHGFVDSLLALRRSGARAGDRIMVSGTVGDAGLALQLMQQNPGGGSVDSRLSRRLDRPTPRVALGRLLVGQASAAIDVSDGLIADLGHICDASGVGARVELARLPLSPAFRAHCPPHQW
ncbi:MAG: thiamine-phosphate kinase, partial [Sedimenticolaceae bacterium]